MKKINRGSFFRQSFAYFWIISNFIFLFLDRRNIFSNKGIDGTVILVGNFILFMATLLSYAIYRHSLKSKNPSAAVRGMLGSFMAKFFVCVIAAFVYIMVAGKEVNKLALVICAGLYIVYTVLEVTSLRKMLR